MQGSLELYDLHGIPSHQLSCGQVMLSDWTKRYCYLEKQKLWIMNSEQPPRDLSFFHESNSSSGGGSSKHHQPEVEDVFSVSSPTSVQPSSGGHYDVGYNKDNQQQQGRRRQQQDNSAAGGSAEQSASKEALPNFIQKKIQPGVRRSKSAKINSGKENRPLDKSSFFAQGGQGVHSRNASEPDLPFYMPSIESPEAIDLTVQGGLDLTEATVRPLHHSILGKDYCFEIITKTQTRCFGCSSAGERQAWIEKIKRAINPNLDNSRRVEHQLSLYVQEAKGLPSKKKYFCEICLDRKLCARTTSKWKTDSSILWGEGFEFTCLPIHEDITVHLYKDSDKKKKKDKDYIGLVNLSVDSLLSSQNYVEKWYNLSTPSGNNKNKAGESMAVRLKARFLSIKVLPTEQYKSFAEYLSQHYLHLCQTLGQSLTAHQKDELAKILVNIMYATGSIKDYMTDLVMDEVEKVEEESLIFRENTVGTKSVEAFLRLVGMNYLHRVFGTYIDTIFTMSDECEVDGSRLPAHADLNRNQTNLRMSCTIAMQYITNSTEYFPIELREVFSIWNERCVNANRPRISFRLITASLFLRLLCPAILNPILFGLANEIPDPKTTRSLTLVAKVVQNLANRSRFGNKEEYMQFMDQFVREQWDCMTAFVDNVASTEFKSLNKGFDGYIDLGKEFARLHSFFVDLMPNLDAATYSSLNPLPSILRNISELLESTQQQHHVQIDTMTNIKQTTTQSTIERISHNNTATLNSIMEDAPYSNATETISHVGCSSSNEVAPQHHLAENNNHTAVAASSLMDLRGINNGSSEPHHQSHTSLAHPTDDVSHTMSSSYDVSRHHQSASSAAATPLKFRNPVFNIQRNNNHNSPPPPCDHQNKPLPQQPSAAPGGYPLSFVNPIQQMRQQQQQQTTTISTTSTNEYCHGDGGGGVGHISSLESRASSHPPRHHIYHQIQPVANMTTNNNTGSQQEVGELPLLIEPTVRSAHLKTGLNQSSSTRSSSTGAAKQRSRTQKEPATTPTSSTQQYPTNMTSSQYPNMSLSSNNDHGPMLELSSPPPPLPPTSSSSKFTEYKDGFVPPEAASHAANMSRIAENIHSSNAVRGKTSKRTHSSSADTNHHHRPHHHHHHHVFQKQISSVSQTTRQQMTPQQPSSAHRRSSHQYHVIHPDDHRVPAATTNFHPPPISPKDTQETRTAQWVLDSIEKASTTTTPSPPAASSSQQDATPITTDATTTAPERNLSPKDYEERIAELESALQRQATVLKEKELELKEARANEKRAIRNEERTRSHMTSQSRRVDDMATSESVLRRELALCKEKLRQRDHELLTYKEAVERMRKNQQHHKMMPPLPGHLSHQDLHSSSVDHHPPPRHHRHPRHNGADYFNGASPAAPPLTPSTAST